MPEVGSASLAIIPSFKGFGRALEQGAGPGLSSAGTSGGVRFGDAAGKSAGRRFGSIFSTAAKASLVGVGALGVGAFKLAKDSVGLASDLNESLNAVNVSYGKQANAVKKLGREAAMSLGLSNTEFNGLSVRFSAFSKTIAGGNGRKVVRTLDDLTTRASDFASVMNLEVNEAAELFQSGLAGETEPLRKYGIDLSAAAVEAFALSEGIVKNKDDLTEAAKVQARYGLLMASTAKTQGDFANTSDSLANRQRILNARWDDARAKLGTALLPMMEDLSGWVLDKGLPAFERFSDWFVETGIPAISDFADDVKPLAKSLLPALGDTLGIARDALKEAAPYAKSMVDAFNDMPDWAKTAIVGGGATLGIGAKLGLGGLTKKAAGSLVSKSAPIPVFVVNEGFGGAGAVGGKKGWLKTVGKWSIPAAVVTTAVTTGKAAQRRDPDAFRYNQSNTSTGIGGAGGIADAAKKFDELTASAGRSKAATDEVRVSTGWLAEAIKGVPSPEITYYTPGLSAALSGTQVLLDRIGYLDGKEARAYVSVAYTSTGRQNLGGLQERASGGYVPGYTDRLLVGERGPEILDLQGASARVTPNHQLRGSGGGGPQRVTLDFGAGRTLSGWIQDEINDAEAFAGTRGRMG